MIRDTIYRLLEKQASLFDKEAAHGLFSAGNIQLPQVPRKLQMPIPEAPDTKDLNMEQAEKMETKIVYKDGKKLHMKVTQATPGELQRKQMQDAGVGAPEGQNPIPGMKPMRSVVPPEVAANANPMARMLQQAGKMAAEVEEEEQEQQAPGSIPVTEANGTPVTDPSGNDRKYTPVTIAQRIEEMKEASEVPSLRMWKSARSTPTAGNATGGKAPSTFGTPGSGNQSIPGMEDFGMPKLPPGGTPPASVPRNIPPVKDSSNPFNKPVPPPNAGFDPAGRASPDAQPKLPVPAAQPKLPVPSAPSKPKQSMAFGIPLNEYENMDRTGQRAVEEQSKNKYKSGVAAGTTAPYSSSSPGARTDFSTPTTTANANSRGLDMNKTYSPGADTASVPSPKAPSSTILQIPRRGRSGWVS